LIGKKPYPSKIQLDAQSVNKAQVIGLFINSQTDNLLAVSRDLLEVFDLKKGRRVSANRTQSPITCADFSPHSDYGQVAVVGCEDGNVLVYEPNELIKLRQFSVKEGKSVTITAISCQAGLIVGYSSGLCKMFNLKTLKEERFFMSSGKGGEDDEEFSSVNHIKVNDLTKQVFISHEEYFMKEGGTVQRLKKTPI